MTDQTPTEQADHTTTLIGRIRAESLAQSDKAVQALLFHECGVLEENRGEEPAAARDYLAAFNADPQFREPLESLVRVLSRRKSVKNLGKLLDALCRAAATPDERARACWERAAFQLAFEQAGATAKELLEEAIATSPEDSTLWLELELCATHEGDAAARMRALEARAELATDPTWKALLFVDLAELTAASGNSARAYELLGAAAALDGRGRFRTQIVLEEVATKDENLEALGRALEGQADLLEEAIDDGLRGDANGVPLFMRQPQYAAEAWLRAAAARRRAGDASGEAQMLERASERLPDSAMIARARLDALERAGDVDGAAAVAKRELERGITGPSAAALWIRLAEAAIAARDHEGAISALSNALQFDKGSLPARALELDQLGTSTDKTALAIAIEAMGESFASSAAKGRALLLAAAIWGAEARDVRAAKQALGRALELGVVPQTVARVGRSLAALLNDSAWYEQATRDLLRVADDAEKANLWFELGRSALLAGDTAKAEAAFIELSATDSSGGAVSWLGRVLAAYGLPQGSAPAGDGTSAAQPRPPLPISRLAQVESDPQVLRGLELVAALRRHLAQDEAGAREKLAELCVALPSDPVSAVFLSELARRADDFATAAGVLSACARELDDAELAAALHIEAALLLWRGNPSRGASDSAIDRVRAVEELEASTRQVPRAAASLLSWALRGTAPDSTEGRRRALEVLAERDGDAAPIALERFALELAAGEPAEALSALEAVERDGAADLAIAGALARLIWPTALEQRPAADKALFQLEAAGDAAVHIACAESFQLARTIDQDRALTLARAATWADREPALYAALEWAGAAFAADDREAEAAARQRIASHFDGAARASIEASAAVVALLDQPNALQPFIQTDEPSAQLMNLELALPGCDPRRRAAALHGLGTTLGDDAQLDALALAAWSDLAAGDFEAARAAFRTVAEHRPEDIVAWEGIRTTSDALADHVQVAVASAQLGSLCSDAARGARFWEEAGRILLEHTDATEDSEIAFERSFERDPRRALAFDKLFRAVRARNEDTRLLSIIERRLSVSENDAEIAKLYWERARVLRKKGDIDGALSALENVTMLEPEHVGALALLGEVYITKADFGSAAPALARLAASAEAPKQQRLMSGIAAVDLFEKKLGMADKALEVLTGLHRAGLSTLAVRERLAGVAARVGAWGEATGILEQLMYEREKREGRIEAARLGMTIWRDKLEVPVRAESSVAKLLDEAPDDPEAVEFVMAANFDQSFKLRQLGRAKQTLIAGLGRNPVDPVRVTLLSKVASFYDDLGLRQATLGALVALGRNDVSINQELTSLAQRVAARPAFAIDARGLGEIADPDDIGPIADLFATMAETISVILGPSLLSLGVTKRERLDARGGHPLRVAVAEWMGALGVPAEFDIYVGGTDPRGVHAVAGEPNAMVLGSAVTAPFDVQTRAAVAREAFALKRGTTSVYGRDDATIASLVAAASIEVGLSVPQPPFAAFTEVARSVRKELPRRLRKPILEVCQRIQQSDKDPREWAMAARRSIDRMGVIAAGDVSLVLGDVLGAPRDQLSGLITGNDRARRLLSFVLSPSYLELRKTLGMGVR